MGKSWLGPSDLHLVGIAIDEAVILKVYVVEIWLIVRYDNVALWGKTSLHFSLSWRFLTSVAVKSLSLSVIF